MSRGDYQRARQQQLDKHAQEDIDVQVGVVRQMFSMGWILAVIIIVVAAIAVVSMLPPMTREEAKRVVAEDNGRGGLLGLTSPETRECALAGECYSWGGTPAPWHKVCFIPPLVIIGVIWVVAVFIKLAGGFGG